MRYATFQRANIAICLGKSTVIARTKPNAVSTTQQIDGRESQAKLRIRQLKE